MWLHYSISMCWTSFLLLGNTWVIMILIEMNILRLKFDVKIGTIPVLAFQKKIFNFLTRNSFQSEFVWKMQSNRLCYSCCLLVWLSYYSKQFPIRNKITKLNFERKKNTYMHCSLLYWNCGRNKHLHCKILFVFNLLLSLLMKVTSAICMLKAKLICHSESIKIFFYQANIYLWLFESSKARTMWSKKNRIQKLVHSTPSVCSGCNLWIWKVLHFNI